MVSVTVLLAVIACHIILAAMASCVHSPQKASSRWSVCEPVCVSTHVSVFVCVSVCMYVFVFVCV